jgi:hypothetical protein
MALARRATAARALASLFALAAAVCPARSEAFWVVNFGSAGVSRPGQVGFVGGTGGQFVLVGPPTSTSAIFFIPHAGLRVGVFEFLDVGYRLAPLALPYSSVGPSLGGNLDVKLAFTPRASPWQFSLDAGGGVAHVMVRDQHRFAYSPNGALLLSARIGASSWLTFMARYTFIGIPTAMGGDAANYVHIAGGSVGFKFEVAPHISLMPELGAYYYRGAVGGQDASGFAMQYGVVLGTSFGGPPAPTTPLTAPASQPSAVTNVPQASAQHP